MPPDDRVPLTSERDLDAETALPGSGVDPPERPQVPVTGQAADWARENLFNTWLNAIITVVFGAGLAYGIYRALRFVFVTARWEIIDRNLTNLMVFRWPERPDLIRPWIAVFITTAVLGALVGRAARSRLEQEGEDVDHPVLPSSRTSMRQAGQRLWPMLLLIVGLSWFSGSPVTLMMLLGVAVVFLLGRSGGLRIPHRIASQVTYPLAAGGLLAAVGALAWFGGYGWGSWGGLLLTLFLAAGGIILSFPFGVGLALGRRSSFPVVRLFSTAYIELIRGVPLITLLLMGSLMLGFFLPDFLSDLHRVSRALVAIILFTAAYVAEIVRGGLQSVPKGQIEAAQAVGLPPLKVTRLIVLPQALRNVIPAMVGQFISLFKDTSLVFIIGLFELFGVAQAITSQGDFAGQGLLAETLVFVSFIYWVFTFTMSRESQRLEKRLGVGER
jgi:general L-amino acid transport system permease protein